MHTHLHGSLWLLRGRGAFPKTWRQMYLSLTASFDFFSVRSDVITSHLPVKFTLSLGAGTVPQKTSREKAKQKKPKGKHWARNISLDESQSSYLVVSLCSGDIWAHMRRVFTRWQGSGGQSGRGVSHLRTEGGTAGFLLCFSDPFLSLSKALRGMEQWHRRKKRRRRRKKRRWWRRKRMRRWKRRRRKRRRRGKAEEGAVCRAGLLWITWSSAGLRIYSSTAAVRGRGASCMLLPQITTKQGHGVSICWIQDSAALLLHALLSPSAFTLMLSLFPSGYLSAFLCFMVLLHSPFPSERALYRFTNAMISSSQLPRSVSSHGLVHVVTRLVLLVIKCQAQ